MKAVGVRLCAPVLGALAVLNMPARVEAQPETHIRAAFRDFDTKVVAVVTTGPACQNCAALVAQWQGLRAQYRPLGLRVLAVVAGQPGPSCDAGWTPDAVLCDSDGTLSRGLGTMPGRMSLWRWDNRIIGHNVELKAARAAIDRFLGTPPEVVLAEGQIDLSLGTANEVTPILRSEVHSLSRFQVMRPQRQMKLMGHYATLEAEAKTPCAADTAETARALWDLGGLLLVASTSRQMTLRLLSASGKCVMAEARSRVTPDITVAIRRALGRLHASLKVPLRLSPPPPTASSRGAAATVTGQFRSEPAGAIVWVDDRQVCPATPCQAKVDVGNRIVRFFMTGYHPHSAPHDFTAAALTVQATLRKIRGSSPFGGFAPPQAPKPDSPQIPPRTPLSPKIRDQAQEAVTNLLAIKNSMLGFMSEFRRCVTIRPDGPTAAYRGRPCPAACKRSDPQACNEFACIGVRLPESTYRYACRATAAGDNFTCAAVADLDNNGRSKMFVIGTSDGPTLIAEVPDIGDRGACRAGTAPAGQIVDCAPGEW